MNAALAGGSARGVVGHRATLLSAQGVKGLRLRKSYEIKL